MTAITKEKVVELREWLLERRYNSGVRQLESINDLLSILDAYSAMRAENERLREENGVFDSELGRLRMENEKWCAREEKK